MLMSIRWKQRVLALCQGREELILNSSGRVKIDCGTYKCSETPEIALTGGIQSLIKGNMGPFQFVESLRKLVESLPV